MIAIHSADVHMNPSIVLTIPSVPMMDVRKNLDAHIHGLVVMILMHVLTMDVMMILDVIITK
jgi:hypothetical protein